MTEARVGRLLAACLHQAIADVLPQRLEFYEHWLNPDGLRDGTIGLGPMTAVLGFLRTEGAAYDRVMAKAGQLAADWAIKTLTPMRRRTIDWLPRPWRMRAALKVAADVARMVSSTTRTSIKVRRSVAHVEVTSSLFCVIREPHATPLCGFYVAVAIESLRQFGMIARSRVDRCRAMDGAKCAFVLDLTGAVVVEETAMAA